MKNQDTSFSSLFVWTEFNQQGVKKFNRVGSYKFYSLWQNKKKVTGFRIYLTSFCFLNLEKVNVLALYSNLHKQMNDARDFELNIKEC